MKYLFFLLLIASIFSFSPKKDDRPNIILIMADDIGFSDIGSYGSEIKTPNLDRLAQNGLRFRTFYNMSKCNPTRSSLLTGLYEGGNGAVHLAHLTKAAGYTNIMSGKEHFDPWVPPYCYAPKVFDESLTFWATTEYFIKPNGTFTMPFILNGDTLNANEIKRRIEPAYKTDFITDYALDWLNEAREKKNPYFLYLPYHAAHYPLQARPIDIVKYRGKYKKGWDLLRKERFARMQTIGILSPNTKLSEPTSNINKFRKPLTSEYTDYSPWENLSDSKKDSLDLEMAVFAAIIDRMDQNIGRLLADLEANEELDNTLIMFLVDNGSCPYQQNEVLNVQPGPADSYWSLRAAWANAGNTPFRYFKQYGHEGGSHTPFIAHWPKKIKANSITDQVGHVVDIAPTFLDILEMDLPNTIASYPTLNLDGNSLLPIFEGKVRKEPAFFLSGVDKFRMFRSGDYKIVMTNGDENTWELYNIKLDPSETNDLALKMPSKLEEMKMAYARIKNNKNGQ